MHCLYYIRECVKDPEGFYNRIVAGAFEVGKDEFKLLRKEMFWALFAASHDTDLQQI